jgi:hypothetical protein
LAKFAEETGVKRLLTATLAGAAALGGSVALAERTQDARTNQAQGEQRSYPVPGFDKIGQVGPNRVIVRVGAAPSVRAQGPRKTLDLYEVVVEKGSLEIRPKRDEDWNFRGRPWRDIQPATYYVTLPRLAGVSAVGSGDIEIDRVGGDRFAASVAGSGTVDVASLAVDSVHVSIAGSGDFIAHGKATDSNISIAGAGNVRARDLASERASISVVGSGDAALTVRNDAHISIMGSGGVDIAGPAHCTVSRFGSGSVRCGNVAQSGAYR